MEKLFYKFLFLLPLAFILIFINVWADPLHLISDRYYQEAGKLLKKNTIEFYNCDERKLALESVQYKTNSAVVVLGSSRTAVLDSTFFEKSLLNLSLSSSSIEDMIAIYGSYIRNHKPPQIVTIGVDPYIFNGNRVRNMKNFVLIHDYNLMMQNMHLTVSSEQTSDLEIMSSKFLNAVSFKYFQQSITFILKNGIKALRPTISTNNATVSLKNKNGVLIYPYKWNSRAGQVDSLVEQDISNDDLVGINGFTKISDARVSLFTSFVHFLASNHIEVILLLTPYHPLMINYIHSQPKYKIISDSEKLIRRIADTEKTKVIGSFVSTCYDLTTVDYYDAVHLKHSGFRKIFNKEYH